MPYLSAWCHRKPHLSLFSPMNCSKSLLCIRSWRGAAQSASGYPFVQSKQWDVAKGKKPLPAHYANSWLRCFRPVAFLLAFDCLRGANRGCEGLRRRLIARCCDPFDNCSLNWDDWLTSASHKVRIRFEYKAAQDVMPLWLMILALLWKLNFARWTAAIWAGHICILYSCVLCGWRFEKRIRDINASCSMRIG